MNSISPNPIVVPVVPPIQPPLPAPPVPSNLQKQFPTYVKLLGLSVAALGAWIQNTLAPDADFQAVFPNAHNAIGIIVMVLGGIGTLCSTFVSTWNNNKFQAVIDHKDAVIDSKDSAISATAEVANQTAALVQVAAESPAIIPPGKKPVWYRLKLALNEAIDQDSSDELIDGIRAQMKKAGTT